MEEIPPYNKQNLFLNFESTPVKKGGQVTRQEFKRRGKKSSTYSKGVLQAQNIEDSQQCPLQTVKHLQSSNIRNNNYTETKKFKLINFQSSCDLNSLRKSISMTTKCFRQDKSEQIYDKVYNFLRRILENPKELDRVFKVMNFDGTEKQSQQFTYSEVKNKKQNEVLNFANIRSFINSKPSFLSPIRSPQKVENGVYEVDQMKQQKDPRLTSLLSIQKLLPLSHSEHQFVNFSLQMDKKISIDDLGPTLVKSISLNYQPQKSQIIQQQINGTEGQESSQLYESTQQNQLSKILVKQQNQPELQTPKKLKQTSNNSIEFSSDKKSSQCSGSYHLVNPFHHNYKFSDFLEEKDSSKKRDKNHIENSTSIVFEKNVSIQLSNNISITFDDQYSHSRCADILKRISQVSFGMGESAKCSSLLTISDNSNDSKNIVKNVKIPFNKVLLSNLFEQPEPFLINLSIYFLLKFLHHSVSPVQFLSQNYLVTYLVIASMVSYKIYYDLTLEGLLDFIQSILKIEREQIIYLERQFLSTLQYQTFIRNESFFAMLSLLVENGKKNPSAMEQVQFYEEQQFVCEENDL